MKFCGLLLLCLIVGALSSPLLEVLSRIRRDTTSAPAVNFGFPVFGSGGSWPGFGGGGFPAAQSGVGGWPQVGGGFGGGGGLHGRFNFDDMPNVEGGQVTSGVSCTYSEGGKQKCTHHQHHERKKN
ncbi:major prion protein-like [Sabethes cyaneus]|uniref:major prion protein-like n=1 Tax=Sabethes cyaneus TaxID=53552 RepID=UPI00237E09D3|nr:major prion protein-like [Sabethes cyaneus]